ncbi:HET-domain-containing protein, partial [Mollisia scopiformis]
MDTYKYEPLDLDKPAVRLLRLLRGELGDVVECDLFQGWIDRDDSGMPYDALSYTWGGTEKPNTIKVHGTAMHVTANLYSALQHLRLKDEDRILWIDAICIDQSNVHERRHQVQHMGEIYKGAEHVVVWLGEGDVATDLLMGTMKRLEERLLEVSGDWRRSAHLWIQPWTDLQSSDERTNTHHRSHLRHGMSSILKRSWFRRIWVLQEIAHARVATIICGNKSISARVFAQIPPLIGLVVDNHCQAILDIMPGFTCKESWWNEDRSLHKLLMKFGHSEASDKRDIIYALLGISSDASDSKILIPEYTKSVREVIRDTTSYI